MKNSKVIVVDDDLDMREALHACLSHKYTVQSFSSAETLLEAFENFDLEDGQPTCILLDFQMPGMTGVQLQSAIREMNSEFPIVFMSGNAHQGDVIDAWHGGAIDFILKPFSAEKISVVLEKIFSDIQSRNTAQTSVTQEQTIIDIPITQREAQVLHLLTKGHQQNEVAHMLGLSLRTIKLYRSNLKIKLSLNNLVELTKYGEKYALSIEKIAQNNKE